MLQTPFDMIDVNDLEGWIRYDSSRMRKENNEQRLERDHGNRDQKPWLRFDDG
jgi:hypothetical protein